MNNYPSYGSQPPYQGAPQGPGYPQQPGSNMYPNIPGYPQQNTPQYQNQPYPGQNPTRPFVPSSQPGYPTQPGYGAPQPGYPQAPPNQPGYGQPQTYPTQPGFQPATGPGGYPQVPPTQPGYGYPPQNPGYQQYPNNMPNYGQGYGMNQPVWDERNYLKKLFDEIDHNRDGEISTQELHEALRRGQTNFEFDPYTVQFLLQKYDKNRDNEIGFQEFHDLYMGLNVQYNEFLDIDKDSSGLIDSRELANALRRKGFNCSQEIFDYVVNEISRRSGKFGISFDVYVRVSARFDHLRNEYNHMPYKNVPMEVYIRERFF